MTSEPPTASETTKDATDSSVQLRMQIMATEHWSLLASRSLAWNETFTRASMFLSTLSAAMVSLALVGQASEFGQDFRVFALVVLPIVLFLGIATMQRMDSANYHDAMCVIGMNRIRAGYLEMAPDMQRFFVMGFTDDFPGMAKTMGVLPDRSTVMNILTASPVIIGVLNSVLVGAIAGIAALELDLTQTAVIIVGAAGCVAMFVLQAVMTMRELGALRAAHQPMFPSEPE